MRKLLIITILYIGITNIILSQCPDYNKLRPGSQTQIGPFPNETFIINYRLERKTNAECCDISKIQYYADNILKSVESYIVSRGNENFYNTIKLESFKVIYHEFTKIPDFYRLQFELSKCGKITYWLTYSYKPNEEVDYTFGIELNSNGKVISKHAFPEYDNNINFENFISVCQALEVAKNQKQVNIEPILSIQLAFLEESNSFCWVVTQDFRPQLKKETSYNVYKANSGYYEINEIYIDANFGRIVKNDKRYGAVSN